MCIRTELVQYEVKFDGLDVGANPTRKEAVENKPQIAYGKMN